MTIVASVVRTSRTMSPNPSAFPDPGPSPSKLSVYTFNLLVLFFAYTLNRRPTAIEFDEKKRAETLEHRGLDFARSAEVFAGVTMTVRDDRRDYGEVRYQTLGRLGDQVVMVVWTPRGQNRRIISMRKGNEKDNQRYAGLGGS